jgi:hypothetical protein
VHDSLAVDHQLPSAIRRWRSVSRSLVLGCGPNAEQQVVLTREERADRIARGCVLELEHPAALFEATGDILRRSARALHHTVEREEGAADDATHRLAAILAGPPHQKLRPADLGR